MHRVRGTSGDALARGTGLPPDLSPRNTPAAFWSVSFVFPPAATRTVALVRPLTRRGGEGHRRGGGGGAGPVQGPGASGPHALVLPKSNTYIWEPVAQPPFEAQTRLGRRARRGGEGLEAGGRDGSFSGALACRPEPSIAHYFQLRAPPLSPPPPRRARLPKPSLSGPSWVETRTTL